MSEKKVRVLYIDDEEHNLKAFRATFRRDYEVHLAISGFEALEMVKKTDFHVIISDQRMPEMTGVEFFEKLRVEQGAPVRMLLTGFADLEAVINAINKGGVYSYLTKPWNENDLRVQIQHAYELYDLRDTNDKLFKQYEQVFRGSTDPIFIVQSDGKVIDMNQATSELFQFEKDELKKISFLDLIQNDDFEQQVKNVLKSSDEIRDLEVTFRNKSGDMIDCIISAKRIASGLRRADKFQGIIKDITDRKAEERRMKTLNEDLEKRVDHRTRLLKEAVDDLGSFAYTVAHDLRSPLKSVMAMITLLNDRSDEQMDDMGRQLVERIDTSSRKMLDLVDDLLEFSQMNRKQMELKTVDLNSVVNNVATDQKANTTNDKATIKIDELPTVQSDPSLMSVVFTNLLSNALKFTRDTEDPRIEIGSKELENEFAIWVEDNGAGFDQRRADRIFGAFKRLHRADEFEGSGVGLAIVERIVKKHGGRVEAEGQLGKGAKISVYLPKVVEKQEALPFME